MGFFVGKSSSKQSRTPEKVKAVGKKENKSKSHQKKVLSVDTSIAGRRSRSALSSDTLSVLIDNLVTSQKASNDKAARTLRKLFSLSETSSSSCHQNRVQMVCSTDGKLVPALLGYLERCEKGSNEQYLALLVLNNISIPEENKRQIALVHSGAQILTRLLCEDPSCHLLAIVLVNLTFCDTKLRGELVAPENEIHLVESLGFALRVASLTRLEYEQRHPLVESDPENPRTCHEMLEGLLAEEDARLQSMVSDDSEYSAKVVLNSSQQLFPETVRWCITAFKNLTRPSKDEAIANAIVQANILPHILRFITVLPAVRMEVGESADDIGESSNSHSSSSTDDTPEPVNPLGDFENNPSQWNSISSQDAALYVIMNLAAVFSARSYLKEVNAVEILSSIANFDGMISPSIEEMDILEFQCLKARVALAYLLGSEGHFGQPIDRRSFSSFPKYRPDHSVIVMPENEILQLVEMLANIMHFRSKRGPGGYSAVTFNVKYVLCAIRCALTHVENQINFANFAGVILNTLLLKVVALHALQTSSFIDEEAAEHACFSLYLLSNYGFNSCFLPTNFGGKEPNISTRILTAYNDMESVTPAGAHAARQMLLRLPYMVFEGEAWELASLFSIRTSDLILPIDVVTAANSVIVGEQKIGAKPQPAIFDRPILRGQLLRNARDFQPNWNPFPSALHAVQELSYGSTKARHSGDVDDIQIANNIANSANGEKTESYSHLWSWKDAAVEIEQNLVRNGSSSNQLQVFFNSFLYGSFEEIEATI